MTKETALLDSIIDKNAAAMFTALSRLITAPSVQTPATPGQPFGPDVAAAFNIYREEAAQLGLAPQDMDGYVSFTEIGAGEEIVGVLSHLDVVPAGEGWDRPPFSGDIADGIIYGRGTLDDKGPAVAVLFALKALQESGLPLKRRIRQIVGGNEETGCACMEYYKNHGEAVSIGFSPDGQFPLIFAEKGIAFWQAKLTYEEPKPKESDIIIKKITAGTAVNAVPGTATAWLAVRTAGWQNLMAVYERHPARAFLKITARDDGMITVKATGKACHAAEPWQGENALWRLLSFLYLLPAIAPATAHNWLKQLYTSFGRDYYGKHAGVDCQDEISGPLTLNLCKLHMADGEASAEFDMRYPVSADFAQISGRLLAHAAQAELDLAVTQHKEPLLADKESFLCRTLLDVYHRRTEKEGEPLAIGGGTYCRMLPHTVAFGPLLPGQEDLMHQANERISCEQLVLLAKIYAEAMWLLAR